MRRKVLPARASYIQQPRVPEHLLCVSSAAHNQRRTFLSPHNSRGVTPPRPRTLHRQRPPCPPFAPRLERTRMIHLAPHARRNFENMYRCSARALLLLAAKEQHASVARRRHCVVHPRRWNRTAVLSLLPDRFGKGKAPQIVHQHCVRVASSVHQPAVPHHAGRHPVPCLGQYVAFWRHPSPSHSLRPPPAPADRSCIHWPCRQTPTAVHHARTLRDVRVRFFPLRQPQAAPGTARAPRSTPAGPPRSLHPPNCPQTQERCRPPASPSSRSGPRASRRLCSARCTAPVARRRLQRRLHLHQILRFSLSIRLAAATATRNSSCTQLCSART
jgi:hypothetical protein